MNSDNHRLWFLAETCLHTDGSLPLFHSLPKDLLRLRCSSVHAVPPSSNYDYYYYKWNNYSVSFSPPTPPAREHNDTSSHTVSRSQIQFLPEAQDDPQRRRPDIRKAKMLLGWEPVVRVTPDTHTHTQSQRGLYRMVVLSVTFTLRAEPHVKTQRTFLNLTDRDTAFFF